MGIKLTKFESNLAEATLEVQDHMVNAYGTVHGAVMYALADHAFLVACNAFGKTSFGLSTNVQFIAPAKPGDKLLARAKEINRTFRIGFYQVGIYKEDVLLTTMDAISYRKDNYFINLEEEL